MHILIVDDHPLTVSIYESILLDENYFFKDVVISKAYNCKEAYNAILKAKNGDKFNLVLVDRNLPSYEEMKIMSGMDLILLIKKIDDKCKTIMITSHTEALIIYDIIRKVNPNGLAAKNDVTVTNLCEIIKDVLNDNSYKSPLIKECIEKIWSSEFLSEDFNRQILLYLAKGYKVKELSGLITLSSSAIQKRVSKLKKVFEVEDDRELSKKIFEQGFL